MGNAIKIAVIVLVVVIVVGVAVVVASQQGMLFKNPIDTFDTEPTMSENGIYSAKVSQLEESLDNTLDRGEILRIEQEVTRIMRFPSSPAEEAQAKLLLARIFIYRYANSQSIVQGVELTKEVAKDTKYPDLWRAMALDRAANLIRDVVDDDYLDTLWNDEFFGTFKSSDLAGERTIKNICDASFELYPLPLCSYRIVGFNIARLVEDRVYPNLSDEDRAGLLSDARAKTEAGNAAFAEYPLPYMNLFDQGKIFLARALNQGGLNLLGQTLPTGFKENAEEDIKKALAIFNSGRILPSTQEGFITYYYAAFLAHMHGEKRLEDVNQLTNRLVGLYDQNRNMAFFLYMKRVGASETSSATSRISMDTAVLAQMNPRFRDLLIEELGWSEAVLDAPTPAGINSAR